MRPDYNPKDAAREFEAARIACAKEEYREKQRRLERRQAEKKKKRERRKEFLEPVFWFFLLSLLFISIYLNFFY